jgi:hypothetical protein
MRKFILIISLISLTIASKVNAQTRLSKEFKKSTIQKSEKLINENYTFEDVAKKTSERVFFDQFINIDSFATALMKEVQFINKHSHMQIRAMTSNTSKNIGSPEKFSDDAIEYIEYNQKKAAIYKFPNSANSFDSFDEEHDLNSKLNLSFISHQKAVDLSTQQNPQLDQFTQNLHKTKQKIK